MLHYSLYALMFMQGRQGLTCQQKKENLTQLNYALSQIKHD